MVQLTPNSYVAKLNLQKMPECLRPFSLRGS